jgi:predicted nucleic acid-binding protein
MARLSDLQGCRGGFDTVVFIYALEGHPIFGDRAIQWFERIERGMIKASACDLVLAEISAVALKEKYGFTG